MASGFTDKFSVRVKKEIEKIKNQKGLKGKLSYIWDYYKVPILAIVIGIIAIVSIVRAIISNNYNTSLYVSYVNCISVDLRDVTRILDNSLTEWLGIDGKKEQVDFSYTFSLKEVAMDEEAFVSANKLYTYASTGSLDGYLSEREYIDYFCTDKDIFFCDLRDIFSDEELEQLDDYIVYFTNTAGETYPIAVDITEAPVIKDSDLNMKDPCYGVVSSSKYQTNAADFIRYIFNMKTA